MQPAKVIGSRPITPVLVIEMYRKAVDQATRNEIAAATAAHRELGAEFDGAVAESLVDRIGAEIDKRIDARLGTRRSASCSPAKAQAPGGAAIWTGAGIGAGITGIMTMIANRNSGDRAVDFVVVVVWAAIAVAAFGAAYLRMRHRSTDR